MEAFPNYSKSERGGIMWMENKYIKEGLFRIQYTVITDLFLRINLSWYTTFFYCVTKMMTSWNLELSQLYKSQYFENEHTVYTHPLSHTNTLTVLWSTSPSNEVKSRCHLVALPLALRSETCWEKGWGRQWHHIQKRCKQTH